MDSTGHLVAANLRSAPIRPDHVEPERRLDSFGAHAAKNMNLVSGKTRARIGVGSRDSFAIMRMKALEILFYQDAQMSTIREWH